MKANGLERIFRQGPTVKLCIFISPTDEYSDFFLAITSLLHGDLWGQRRNACSVLVASRKPVRT